MSVPPTEPVVGHRDTSIPAEALQPRPAAEMQQGIEDDGTPAVDSQNPYAGLVYPGETLRCSTTLAVQLPGDDKESYYGAAHTAIVQDGEDFNDVGGRLLKTVNELVVANVDASLDMLNDKFGQTPEDDPNQPAA